MKVPRPLKAASSSTDESLSPSSSPEPTGAEHPLKKTERLSKEEAAARLKATRTSAENSL